MKNRILFSLVVAVIPFFSFAQIDDMYFVPQKETKEQFQIFHIVYFMSRIYWFCKNSKKRVIY